MVYMGSKNKYAKYLLPIILKDRRVNQYYVEPFCGGCNLIDKVEGNRIANDINKYLIALFIGLIKGKRVEYTINEEVYKIAHQSYKIKSNEIFSDFELGFIGFLASVKGKFFNGYSGNYPNRNYLKEMTNNIMKQIPNLTDVEFHSVNYQDLIIPDNSIIYCDIPYKVTTKYKNTDFNYDEFYQYVIDMKNKGHQIFFSEYNAPDYFTCIWEKEVTVSLSNSTTQNKTEKLFTI